MKPRVHFLPPAQFFKLEHPDHGEITLARVYATDHPRLGKGDIRTSIVQHINDDGSFETMNTVYVPAWQDAELVKQAQS